jgi:phage shock protein PspC (stress-responsive transcriptional regulator)
MMDNLRNFIEWHVFGVCTRIGEVLGIPTSTIRKYFMYTSCLTFGSPLIIYLIAAFWMNLKQYIFRSKRNPFRYS